MFPVGELQAGRMLSLGNPTFFSHPLTPEALHQGSLQASGPGPACPTTPSDPGFPFFADTEFVVSSVPL